MKRRTFIKQSAVLATGLGLSGAPSLARDMSLNKNKLPRWRGFNLLDFFSPNPASARSSTTEEQLKWMQDWGFDFVRIPMAYPSYLKIDRTRNITPEDVYKIDEKAVDNIDNLVAMAHKHNLHVSLNLHRAPGYCINAGFNEPYNLWIDKTAQEAFNFHWGMWAKRYKDVSNKKISFDLVNEPTMREDMNDQHSKRGPVPGALYRNVAQGAARAIRKENKKHLIIADGNSGGNVVIPELIDLDIAQSCRGYNPGHISHYKAPWANKDPESLPEPKWPGQMGNTYWDKSKLETFYQPWIDLVNKGVGVHCGECGCWKKTPHAVFLAWFEDVLDILTKNNIGYALWEFSGDFGVLNSGRTDIEYEDWFGQKLDRKLLNLLQKY